MRGAAVGVKEKCFHCNHSNMSTQQYYLVPGPVTVPNKYLQLYAKDYGSSKRTIDVPMSRVKIRPKIFSIIIISYNTGDIC